MARTTKEPLLMDLVSWNYKSAFYKGSGLFLIPSITLPNIEEKKNSLSDYLIKKFSRIEISIKLE